MSGGTWRIRLSAEAAASLKRIHEESPGSWTEVVQAIQRFQASPTRESQPSIPPFQPDVQLYRAPIPGATELVLLFRYSTDESTLEVEQIIIWKP